MNDWTPNLRWTLMVDSAKARPSWAEWVKIAEQQDPDAEITEFECDHPRRGQIRFTKTIVLRWPPENVSIMRGQDSAFNDACIFVPA